MYLLHFYDLINQYIPAQSLEEQWDIQGLQQQLASEFMLSLDIKDILQKEDDMDEEKLREFVCNKLAENYEAKKEVVGTEVIQQFEKAVMLQNLDHYWKEHLAAMDYLRHSIYLSGYAQKDPKQE